MVTNTREKIGMVLDDLKRERRRAFQRGLTQFHVDGGLGNYPTRQTTDRALRALDLSVYENLSEAVSRVLPMSSTPSAFAQIEHAMVSLFFDLSQDLENWYQAKGALPSASIVDKSWAEALRQRLERQLDTYRSEFTDTGTGSTRNSPGPKFKYDWFGAANAVWGQLYRAELIAEDEAQAGIERAILTHFEAAGKDPGEATVRPYAKRLYIEAMKKGQ